MLRTTREGPLPGQTLALLDAQSELVVELIPCECGHAQERSLLPELLEWIRADTVLFGLFRRGAYFLIRQHASTLSYRFEGRRRKIGHCEAGLLYEQTLILTDDNATEGEEPELKVRRITLQLDTPTQASDGEIHLLTNLPVKVRAKRVAETDRLRWTIEGAFQTLTDVLRCEVETPGDPKAALFLVRDGGPRVERLCGGPSRPPLDTRRTEDRRRTLGRTLYSRRGPHPNRHGHRGRSSCVGTLSHPPPIRFAQTLARLAKQVDLKRYPKHKRGPKKPRPKQTSGQKNHHVSTAKLLAKKSPTQITKKQPKQRP